MKYLKFDEVKLGDILYYFGRKDTQRKVHYKGNHVIVLKNEENGAEMVRSITDFEKAKYQRLQNYEIECRTYTGYHVDIVLEEHHNIESGDLLKVNGSVMTVVSIEPTTKKKTNSFVVKLIEITLT